MATLRKYKVTAVKVNIGGEIREKGQTFEAESKSAHVQTALHFKQIIEVPEKESEADSKAKAKAEADEKAKADSKAKE